MSPEFNPAKSVPKCVQKFNCYKPLIEKRGMKFVVLIRSRVHSYRVFLSAITLTFERTKGAVNGYQGPRVVRAWSQCTYADLMLQLKTNCDSLTLQTKYPECRTEFFELRYSPGYAIWRSAFHVWVVYISFRNVIYWSVFFPLSSFLNESGLN